jgi:hypothetical protein
VDCEIEEAFDALADLNGLADRERMLANAERDEDGRLLAAGIACTPADAPDDAELGEDDAIGAILLRRGKLFVIAPTRAVLAEIDAGIIARLGDRARPSSEEPASSPPPVIGARRRTAEEETRLWLDRPNADLRDLTPREAAGTPAGRERLWALLCDLEREDPYTDEEIDVARVRSELKLEPHPR